MQPSSLTFRLVAGATIWSVVAFVSVGIILSSLFRDSVVHAFDERLNIVLNSLVSGSEVSPSGQLVMTSNPGDPRFDQALSGWYWQIEGPRGVGAPPGPDMRSGSLWDYVLIPPEKRTPGVILRADIDGPGGQTLHAIVRDITLPGSGLPFVFTVAGDRLEMTREIRRFNELLAWSLSGIGIGLVVAVIVLIRIGLAPLRRVSAALAAIRSGQASRLEGKFPIEIQPLADELNALVDHNASLLERARRHMGNLAHALKTPISVLTNEAESPNGPSGETLRKQLAIMKSQVDHQLARARMAATGGLITSRTAVAPILGDLARTLKRIYAERNLEIAAEVPETVAFRGESEDFEEMAGNLMDNASKWARTRVVVTASLEDGGSKLVLSVEDDGPGLPQEAVKKVLKRGTRLDETVPGSGLGLSIVQDICELYGGGLAFDPSPLGGLRATLTLPAAEAAALKSA